jgi:hypothetical protein
MFPVTLDRRLGLSVISRFLPRSTVNVAPPLKGLLCFASGYPALPCRAPSMPSPLGTEFVSSLTCLREGAGQATRRRDAGFRAPVGMTMLCVVVAFKI